MEPEFFDQSLVTSRFIDKIGKKMAKLKEILVDLELHIYFADTENFHIIKKLTEENADRISNMLIENNVDLKINEDNSLKLFINKKKVNVLKKNQ